MFEGEDRRGRYPHLRELISGFKEGTPHHLALTTLAQSSTHGTLRKVDSWLSKLARSEPIHVKFRPSIHGEELIELLQKPLSEVGFSRDICRYFRFRGANVYDIITLTPEEFTTGEKGTDRLKETRHALEKLGLRLGIDENDGFWRNHITAAMNANAEKMRLYEKSRKKKPR